MTTQQKIDFRDVYTQLKLQLLDPGESYAGFRRLYQPVSVNKDGWTWEQAMSAPDTPAVARERRYEKTMWLMIGQVA